MNANFSFLPLCCISNIVYLELLHLYKREGIINRLSYFTLYMLKYLIIDVSIKKRFS